MNEDLKEAKQSAISRRIDVPKKFKENYWYKVNPYSSLKIFVDPPQGDMPDHVREMMLKELLKAETMLRKERKRKLKAIKTISPKVGWFLEVLEASEFAEYYHIQKWINKLLYGHVREG